MKQQNVISAESIKNQLIDFFITDFSNDLFIGNEVMYGTKRKLIDLLILHKNQLIAIEIKADNDDLRRLQEQINESKKIFDYIIVCTTLVHLEKTKQILPDDIGIYSVNEQGIKKIRKPKKQKELDKTEILYSINSNYLKKNLKITASNLNSDEIRQQYIKESTSKIRTIFSEYMKTKIEPKFNLFLRYRGNCTLIEDMNVLSGGYMVL